MIVRFTRTIALPSGNEARNFRFHDRGHGRVQVTYVYTDRRRAHHTARRYTVEFLNGKLDSIQARSSNGGRVEFFKSSTIINELIEMLNEFNEVVNGVAESYRSEPAKVETVEPEQHVEDNNLLDTLKVVGGMVMFNILITLVTLGIVWYNL